MIHLHTFKFLRTPFLTIVTTNGSGEKEATQYLTKIGYLFGGLKIGAIWKSANDKLDIKAYNSTVTKTNAVLTTGKVRPAFINQLYFSSMKSVIKKNKDYFKAEIKQC